ncbi:Heterogeneous nuclear ribonucleoprotein 1 [Apostasia shenzhenica]|uniref:Heterogeneous nuclear ribonucleoprotein 1 n=1 Tax=Apostasia shenzhenica TaxID=1088818 RepID=A0A2I0AFA6_9ASPA|nr:Heterogeneous nuclear ribonucleoprotein 1 [Apostasia shenzhenica]
MESSPSSSSASWSSPSPMLAEPAKLFLGGITKELPEDVLKEYFSAYGEVKDVVVIRDRSTGNVRGFGFLEFVNAEAAERVISEKKQHLINNKSIEVKRARPRLKEHYHQYSVQNPRDNRGFCRVNYDGYNTDENHIVSKKIFVGGLSADVTETEFRNYFEKFGSINDVVIMYDSVTHRPRGFGFVTFNSEEAVENVMQKNFHELNEKLVEVKKAVPKDNYHHINGSNYNRKNGYLREGCGMEPYGNYQPGFYPTYGSRTSCYYGYMPQPYPSFTYGLFGLGSYTYGAYGEPWYGVLYGSSGAWNGHNYMASRWSPSATAVYPGYTDYAESYRTMSTGGNNGAVFYGNGKSNQDATGLQKNTVQGSKGLQNTEIENRNSLENGSSSDVEDQKLDSQ